MEGPETPAVTDSSLGYLRALRAHIARAYGGMQSTRPLANRFFGKRYVRVPGRIEGALVEESGNQGAAFVFDLTERKRPEETLRGLTHKKPATSMGEVAASLAHEITQPIAAARNNARAALNFLDKQPPDLDEVREALGSVVGDADRAGEIIDRIHDHIKKGGPAKESY